MSRNFICAWKLKYGGMEVSEAEEVKHLRDENSRLKKLVADLSLDKDMLQSVIQSILVYNLRSKNLYPGDCSENYIFR
jgi:Transposase